MPYDIYEHGDLMTLEEFVEAVKFTLFTDWDGDGYYCDGFHQNKEQLSCKDIYNGIISNRWSHVVWYNK